MPRFHVRIVGFLIAVSSFGAVAADRPDDAKAITPGGPGVLTKCRGVNAGEKMHQRAGVKLHHRWMPNAPREGFLRRDKQGEKCVASAANVAETSSVA